MKEEFDDLKEEMEFPIGKDSFKGPFTCHRRKTKKTKKTVSYGDITFTYDVWQCSKCKKEFRDFEQAKQYEKFLMMRKLLDDRVITLERSMNYDGKTFFVRFPKEISKNFSKHDHIDMKLLSLDGRKFLLEVKSA